MPCMMCSFLLLSLRCTFHTSAHHSLLDVPAAGCCCRRRYQQVNCSIVLQACFVGTAAAYLFSIGASTCSCARWQQLAHMCRELPCMYCTVHHQAEQQTAEGSVSARQCLCAMLRRGVTQRCRCASITRCLCICCLAAVLHSAIHPLRMQMLPWVAAHCLG